MDSYIRVRGTGRLKDEEYDGVDFMLTRHSEQKLCVMLKISRRWTI